MTVGSIKDYLFSEPVLAIFELCRECVNNPEFMVRSTSASNYVDSVYVGKVWLFAKNC